MKFPLTLRVIVLLVGFVAAGARLDAKIGALGRVIPAGDVINLPGAGDIVTAIHVKEGDLVEAGAPLISFRSRESALNDVKLAELGVQEARDLAQLAIDALALKVEISQREFEFAKLRHDRFSKLGGEEISAQQMEVRAYQMRNAELNYQAAQKELARAKEDRAIKLERTAAQLAVARDKLARTTLTAPATLTVIKVYAVTGVTPGGVAIALGNVSEMHVVTEVFAGDLPGLKVGQEATVTSSALPGPVKARVLSIGRLITGRAKVAEVLLRLDDPAAAAKLINLEVNVSIEN
jgi:multidrug resistance efflux pump